MWQLFSNSWTISAKGKRNTVLQVNGIRSHRLAQQAGYINDGKHHNKLEGYKDLTESLDKPVPEITRAAHSLWRPERPGWFQKVPPKSYDPLTRHGGEKKKEKAIDYYFNFHAAASLEDSIPNDHIKLLLITVYLITYCIKQFAAKSKLYHVTFHDPMETINQWLSWKRPI